MVKKNSRWAIATNPPEITLSKLLFIPKVPEEVLSGVNRLDVPFESPSCRHIEKNGSN